jgi:hypothetical protein
MGTSTQPIRLIDQKINPLTPLQQSLNILAHNASHVINLALNIRNRILLARLRRSVLHHQFLQLRVKATRTIAIHCSKIRAIDRESFQESLLDFDEKPEWDPAAETRVCDD